MSTHLAKLAHGQAPSTTHQAYLGALAAPGLSRILTCRLSSMTSHWAVLAGVHCSLPDICPYLPAVIDDKPLGRCAPSLQAAQALAHALSADSEVEGVPGAPAEGVQAGWGGLVSPAAGCMVAQTGWDGAVSPAAECTYAGWRCT